MAPQHDSLAICFSAALEQASTGKVAMQILFPHCDSNGLYTLSTDVPVLAMLVTFCFSKEEKWIRFEISQCMYKVSRSIIFVTISCVYFLAPATIAWQTPHNNGGPASCLSLRRPDRRI